MKENAEMITHMICNELLEEINKKISIKELEKHGP
jgi:hypothetical protein